LKFSAPGCITPLATENNTKEGKRQKKFRLPILDFGLFDFGFWIGDFGLFDFGF